MIAELMGGLIDLYSLVVIAAVVVSWIDVDPENPVVRFLRQVTEPVLEPIRRVLPDTWTVDLSPLVLLLALALLRSLLGR